MDEKCYKEYGTERCDVQRKEWVCWWLLSLYGQGGLPGEKIWGQIIIGEECKYERCETREHTERVVILMSL